MKTDDKGVSLLKLILAIFLMTILAISLTALLNLFVSKTFGVGAAFISGSHSTSSFGSGNLIADAPLINDAALATSAATARLSGVIKGVTGAKGVLGSSKVETKVGMSGVVAPSKAKT